MIWRLIPGKVTLIISNISKSPFSRFNDISLLSEHGKTGFFKI